MPPADVKILSLEHLPLPCVEFLMWHIKLRPSRLQSPTAIGFQSISLGISFPSSLCLSIVKTDKL